jgi:hypothetical protein
MQLHIEIVFLLSLVEKSCFQSVLDWIQVAYIVFFNVLIAYEQGVLKSLFALELYILEL